MGTCISMQLVHIKSNNFFLLIPIYIKTKTKWPMSPSCFCVVSGIDKEAMVFVIKIMAMVVTEDKSVVKNVE